MSKYTVRGQAITITNILAAKAEGKKLSVITCYDSSMARLVDQTGIDIVLVGDTLGNVMLGYDNTIPVTLDEMRHHAAAVARVLTKPFLTVDMPFLSYNLSVPESLRNAGYLVQKGGAQAVKVEGGRSIVPHVRAMVEAGIPVMGHLGLTPQSVHAMGGYKIQGRGEEAAKNLKEDALALQEAGVFSIVLEMVPAPLAAEVTKLLKVPTIGIGAGPHCDGQVLVLQDMLGFDADFNPKFLKKYANLGAEIKAAIDTYVNEVKSGEYPTPSHSFTS